MKFLILGMIIFYGVHLIPIIELRNKIINRIGKNRTWGCSH